MKFSFSRAALISFSILTASMASARTFSADFVSVNSENFVSASANVDYRTRTLVLSLQPKMPECQEGFSCIQAFPAARTYTFQKVMSKADRCGFVITTALDDQLPVDGVRTEVTLVDKANSRCNKPFADTTATLTVKTAFYNRFEGRLVETLDRFAADNKPYLIDAELSVVSSERYQSGFVRYDSRTRTIELSLKSVEAGEDEAAYVQKIAQAKTKVDNCGIIRTIASVDNRPADGALRVVTINDNRKNTCPTFVALADFDVIVKESYYSRLDQGELEFVDVLKSK